MEHSPTFRVRLAGLLACFTRPEFKVERVSYEVITPSAARGILEAILWKPAIQWVVERIHVLAPIRFVSFKRNEIDSRISVRNVLQEIAGKPMKHFFADEHREQRNTTALKDVDYVVEAHYCSSSRWTDTDNYPKYNDMFRRRLENGQTYHSPYFGCREFAAMVESVDTVPKHSLPEEQKDKNLGWMLYDLDFGATIRPMFFEAKLVDGVMEVPAPEMVKKMSQQLTEVSHDIHCA